MHTRTHRLHISGPAHTQPHNTPRGSRQKRVHITRAQFLQRHSIHPHNHVPYAQTPCAICSASWFYLRYDFVPVAFFRDDYTRVPYLRTALFAQKFVE